MSTFQSIIRNLCTSTARMRSQLIEVLREDKAPGSVGFDAIEAIELEDRVLYSAAPLPVDVIEVPESMEDVHSTSDLDQTLFESTDYSILGQGFDFEEHTTVLDELSDQLSELEQVEFDYDSPIELVFIDETVPGFEALVENIQNRHQDQSPTEIIMLEPQRDGIRQVTEVLSRYENVGAVHVVSHGSAGELQLGNRALTSESLHAYENDLRVWGDTLNSDADLMIYGCDLASNVQGRSLIQSIGELCGCDVAASDDSTGHLNYGGDWDLEFVTGTIETEIAFSASIAEGWLGKLAVVNVDTNLDVLDGDTSSVANLLANKGSDGFISIREAVIAVNNGAGGDTINLLADTYTLTLTAGIDDDQGDLDIRKDVSIVGVSPTQTVVDGNNLHRVFQIHNDAAINVSLSNIKIQNGSTSFAGETEGAGILIEGTGIQPVVNLDNIWLTGNHTNGSVSYGGAILNRGDLTITNSLLEGNSAEYGGGVANDLVGTLSKTNVTVSGNNATSGLGGGIFNQGTATLQNVTVTDNTASGAGGGIHNDDANSATTNINNTLVANNAAATNADVDGAFVSSVGDNLIESPGTATGLHGSDITGVDPNLGDLNANGGDTKTHALLLGSAAIDAGSTTGAPAVDQRGISRSAPIDIGAFEYVAPKLEATDETRVNDNPTGNQATRGDVLAERGSHQAVAMDGFGNSIVVWSDSLADGSGWGIFGQRFDSSGSEIGTEFQVNTVTLNDQYHASVAADGSGRFVVVFTGNDANGKGVFLRRFNADGSAIDLVDVLVNAGQTSGDQFSAAVSTNTSGQMVVAWQNDAAGIYARTFDMESAAPGDQLPSTLVTVDSVATSDDPAVDINDSGRYVVTWEQDGDLFGQRYDFPSATALSAKHDLNLGSFSEHSVVVAVQEDNDFAIAYRSDVFGFQGVWTTLFRDNGIGYSFATRASARTSAVEPSIDMAANGDFVIVYQDDDGDGTGVFARKYDSNRSAQGSEFQVSTSTALDQQMSSVAVYDLDNFVVAWSGNGDQTDQIDGDGVFVRQFGTAPSPGSPPVADPESFTVAEGGTATESDLDTGTSLLDGDTDPDLPSDTLTINTTPVVDVNHGTLTLFANGTFTYVHDGSENFSDSFVYEVSDAFGNTDSATVSITITPVNETPTDLSPNTFSVDENTDTSGGFSVGTLSATDPDNSETFAYSIVGGADQARFSIGGAGDQLILTDGVLDFETQSSYLVTIRVTDSAFNTYDETLTINVNDLNEAPSVALTPVVSALDEDADTSSPIVVATIAVTDDALGSETLTLAGDDASLFEVVGTDLRLIAGASLDFETNGYLDVTIQVDDASIPGFPDGTDAITITVNDIVEPTVFLAVADTYINESPPSYNYGASNSLVVNKAGGDFGNTRTLLQFDVSSIPVGATFTSATLKMEAIANTGGAFNVNIYELTQSWIEGLEDGTPGEANWNDRSTTNGWSSAGGDFDTTLVAGLNTGSTGLHSWDVTSLVQDWVDGIKTNNGILIGSPDIGSATFTYDSREAGPTTAPRLELTYSIANAPPTDITPNSFNINENTDTTGGTTVGVLSASDPDVGESFSYSIVGGTDQALFSIGGGGDELVLNDGILDFESKSSYSVIVRVTDSASNTYDETLVVNVNNIADIAPVADSESFTVSEGATATEADLDAGTSLLDGDTDVDLPGDTLNVNTTPITGPSHGTLLLNADGTFVYTHDDSENFTDSFTYEVVDAGGNSDIATVTITITPVNDNAPVADDESFTVAEGGTATESDLDAGTSLLDDDLDLDLPGDTLQVNTTPIIDVNFGTLTLFSDGRFIYVHDDSENFTDSFTYEVVDALGNSDTATVTISITPVNDNAPVADDESLTLARGCTATETDLNVGSSLLDGDLDLDLPNDNLTVNTTPTLGPSHGVLLLNSDGTFSYTHDGSLNLSDSFVYEVTDAFGNTDTATVLITINTGNAPVADNESFSVTEGGTATEANLDVGTSLLDGDTDPDLPADTLIVNPTPTVDVNHGTLTLFANGTFIYVHDGSENFADSFTYEVIDAIGNSSFANVAISILPVNESPTAINDGYLTLNQGVFTPTTPVTANDVDPEGAALTWSITTGPTNGTLVINPDGTFSYQPNVEFTGIDTFIYEVTDGTSTPSSATVSITVSSLAPPPPAALPTAPAVNAVADDSEDVDETAPESELAIARPSPGPPGNTEPAANSTSTISKEVEPIIDASSTLPTHDFDSKSDLPLLATFARSDHENRHESDLEMSHRVPFAISKSAIEVFDTIKEEMSEKNFFSKAVIGSTTLATASLSVGYVVWLIRGGVLFSSVLTSLPAWRMVDPLPVLGFLDDEDEDETADDSLEQLVAKSNLQHEHPVQDRELTK
ncbi:MAG: Ig-like domain-containing protein [Planctomycetota bacterium]